MYTIHYDTGLLCTHTPGTEFLTVHCRMPWRDASTELLRTSAVARQATTR